MVVKGPKNGAGSMNGECSGKPKRVPVKCFPFSIPGAAISPQRGGAPPRGKGATHHENGASDLSALAINNRRAKELCAWLIASCQER